MNGVFSLNNDIFVFVSASSEVLVFDGDVALEEGTWSDSGMDFGSSALATVSGCRRRAKSHSRMTDRAKLQKPIEGHTR